MINISTNLSEDHMEELKSLISIQEIESHIWRYIDDVNHRNHYAICDDGQFVVRFTYWATNHTVHSKVWSVSDFAEDEDGYFQCSSSSVHRLVGFAFLERIEGKNCINHKDGDIRNNSYLNLEWCTPKENTHHFRTADCFREKRIEHDRKMSENAKGKTHTVSEETKSREFVTRKTTKNF